MHVVLGLILKTAFWNMQRRDSDDGVSAKKARVVWSVEMHQQFVQAVNQLGIDSASQHPLSRLCRLIVLSWLLQAISASHMSPS